MRVPYALVSRGFISQGGRFLLCRAQGYDFWFLPGGGVEDGEDATDALHRELLEETGLIIHEVSFLSTMQNRFLHKGAVENEINLIFSARLDADVSVSSLEEHIEVQLFSADEIEALNILPPSLKQALLHHARGTHIPNFIGLKVL